MNKQNLEYQNPKQQGLPVLSLLSLHLCTGGPRYMRSFYLRIRVYAIEKYKPKFVICDILNDRHLMCAIFNETFLII